jgi:hypothetical protein
LVVIAIIAVLIALLVPAVMKLLSKGPIASNLNDIHQLESAAADFHRELKLSKEYFPSRFVLCESYQDYLNPPNANYAQLYADSLGFLQRAFPRLWRTPQAQTIVVDWDGDGQYSPPVILEGDQCLVFFLGGVPAPPGQPAACMGFSSVGSNPAIRTGARIGPFFEFTSARLALLSNRMVDPNGPQPGYKFYSYLDYYRVQPYLYFSSFATPNGYNKYFSIFGNSDCYSAGVWPYAEFVGTQTSPPRYIFPTKFQIVSAGADTAFGPGTNFANNPQAWTPANAGTISQSGKDDQSNFYAALLGVPQ